MKSKRVDSAAFIVVPSGLKAQRDTTRKMKRMGLVTLRLYSGDERGLRHEEKPPPALYIRVFMFVTYHCYIYQTENQNV